MSKLQRLFAHKYAQVGITAFLIAVVAVVGMLLLSDQANKEYETPSQEVTITPVDVPEGMAVATFAGGCFWCTEAAFQETEGVSEVISGYAGGTEANPTYEEVYTMQTTHREAVQITYDPNIITYEELLDILWRSIDPTDDGGQFVDRGFAYTTAIFYHNDQQHQQAQASKTDLDSSGRFDQSIVTPIIGYTTFYPAEDYHQDFYKKSSERYESYESASGRDQYKARIWEEIMQGS